jgi:hypothetical protein
MINFYKLTKKNSIKNSNYAINHLEYPFRMIICGGSGAGKSNSLLNLLTLMNGDLTQINICVYNKNEKLYEFLEQKLEGNVKFYEKGDVPVIEDFDNKHHKLLVFDDLVLSDQKKISDYFLRARKYNISSIYLSQSYFKVPKFIRCNSNYLVLMRNLTRRDLKLILSDISTDMDIKELSKIYHEYVVDMTDCIIFDQIKKEIRYNFVEKICDL